MKSVGIRKRSVLRLPVLTVSMTILIISTVYLSIFPNTSVSGWDDHITLNNNTPFPLKFHIEGAEDCTANASQSCNAGAEALIYYNVYICPGVFPFDDNGTLTESNCNLAAYEFFKYAEPELVKALEEIALALQEAQEEDNAFAEATLKTLNQTVGGIQPEFAHHYYVLSWKTDVKAGKTVNATIDSSTGKLSLSD